MRYGSRGFRREGQEGFALLASLIAILGLTALATGGFLLAKSERVASSNHHAIVEAFYLADAGLNQYLAVHEDAPLSETVSYGPYEFAEGTAAVSVTRVGTAGAGDGAGLFLVESQGRYDPNGTGRPVTRTVRAVSLLDLSVVPRLEGVLTSAAGIRDSRDTGEIDGNDACGVEPAVAGLRVPVDGYSGSESEASVRGDPAVEEVSDPLDLDGDGATDDEARWWQGVLDGTGVRHDHVIDDADDAWPRTEGDEMPVTFVDRQAYRLGSDASGRGLLVVRGDVAFGGNFRWEGVILVGGSIADGGVGQIEGGVVTGLNELLGEDVARDQLRAGGTLDGAKRLLFHSCYVEQVRRSTAVLAELPGTWHERI